MYTKVCKICGDTFQSKYRNASICKKDHYLICPVCGKRYVHNSLKSSKGCSRSCAAKASMDKKRKTNLERYGTEYAVQSKAIKEKIEKTNLRKYGTTNPMGNKDVSTKSRKSRKTSYKESHEKARKTCLERYGVDNPFKSEDIKKKIKANNKSKYGFESSMKCKEANQKIIEANIKRYGIDRNCDNTKSKEDQDRIISDTDRKFVDEIAKLGITYSFDHMIDSFSYDICLEDQKILIDIDHTCKNSTYGNEDNGHTVVSADYHLKKTKLANAYGYRVIHIFDWDNKDKIIQSLMPKKRVYARQCSIYMLKPSVARQFTAKYHLQGSCRGQACCLGLVKDDELLEVMTFGNPRYNKKYDYELLRLCTKFGYEVIGGASKLFSFATKYFEISNIISYCDYSKFNGLVYSRMGMTLSKITPPQEVWSRDKQFVSANLLRELGYDQLFGKDYGKGASNELLMLINGWLPVFDCGQKVFEYKIDE